MLQHQVILFDMRILSGEVLVDQFPDEVNELPLKHLLDDL